MAVSNKVVLRNLIWRYAERFLAQIVAFIVSLLLARLLSPEEYGIVALINVVVGFLDVFSTRGFNQALIQKKEVDALDYSTIFIFNMGINSCLYLIVFFVAPSIAFFYGDKNLAWMIRILSLRILVTGFNSIQQAYVQRNMQFKKFFYSTLGGTVFSAIVGVVMAINGMGAWALIMQSLTNTCIDTLVLFATVEWKPQLIFSIERLREIYGFGIRMFFYALIESIYNQLRSLIVGKVYTSADLAYYNKGQELPGVVINNVQASAGNVFFSALSRENEIINIKRKVREYYSLMFYIISPLLLGLIALSNQTIELLYSKKWISAVPYLIIYCCSYLTWVPQMPMLQAINALGMARKTLWISIIHRSIGIALLLLMMFKGPLYIAYSALIADVVITIIIYCIVKEILDYKIDEFFTDTSKTLMQAVVMMVSVSIVANMISNTYVSFVVSLITGMIIYILLSVICKNSCYRKIVNFVKEYRNRNESI